MNEPVHIPKRFYLLKSVDSTDLWIIVFQALRQTMEEMKKHTDNF